MMGVLLFLGTGEPLSLGTGQRSKDCHPVEPDRLPGITVGYRGLPSVTVGERLGWLRADPSRGLEERVEYGPDELRISEFSISMMFPWDVRFRHMPSIDRRSVKISGWRRPKLFTARGLLEIDSVKPVSKLID